MDKYLSLTLVVLLIPVLFGLMFLGWRARKRRQAGFPQPASVPADLSDQQAFTGFYVATTVAGEPLNRIAVRGLGFRAKTTVSVAEAGVVIHIAGQDDIFVPIADIREIVTATWTIDRVVEEGGLTLLAWNLGDSGVDSYFRMDEPQTFIGAVTRVLGNRIGSESQ